LQISEVLALRVHVSSGRNDDTHVDRVIPGGPNCLDLPGLERAKKLRLDLGGTLAKLIEEDGFPPPP